VPNGGVPADDPGLLFGMTVFETFRTYDGIPFRLEQHLQRLVRSAAAMNIALSNLGQIKAQMMALCQGNVSIRYTVTAGGQNILQRAEIGPHIVNRTMRVASYSWVNPQALPGVVKHGCRAAWMLAAEQRGVDEVLLVDPTGHILEANRSNVFAVIDGTLVTPPLDGRQLAGVTRQALLESAAAAGLPVEETPLLAAANFEELYLVSTLKELSPVIEMDGNPLPKGGPLGRTLLSSFRELVARETSRA